MYKDTFQDALDNLEKVLVRCQVKKLSLDHEQCKFLLTKGVMLDHHISPTRIGLDLAKTKFIRNLLIPTTEKVVHSFLGYDGYGDLLIIVLKWHHIYSSY